MNEKITGVLIASRIYRDYTKAFRELTGLPLSLRPLGTAPGQERKRWSSTLFVRKNCRCLTCAKGFVRIVGGIPAGGAIIKCTNGCCGAAVPVRSGREVIALLQVGPVRSGVRLARQAVISDKRTHDTVSHTVKRAPKPGEFVLVPFSPRQCHAALKLLGIFAEQLEGLGNQMLVQTQNGEPSVISRAKEFISRHYGEDISSGHVAKELHLSRFYFCKLFKGSTGLTITAYVSRVRTERVKELLLNPNLRISEIAFQTGFQSLTHFNRTFLKLIGQSPTEYRARLRAI